MAIATAIWYNSHFDLTILSNAGIYAYGSSVDVMIEDAERRGHAKWRKLGKTAAAYGYFLVPHDSLEDCEATLHIYKRMFPEKNVLVKIWDLFLYILPVIAFALLRNIFIQEGVSFEPGFILLAMMSYQYGLVRGSIAGLLLGILCFGNIWNSVLVFVITGIALAILYRFASIFRFLPLKVLYVAVCTAAIPYIIVYLSTMGLPVVKIFTDDIIVNMMVCSPLYMFLKQPIRRFL